MAAETTGGGWLSTLLGGAFLAVAGFGVGMLAGGLWESPDLVFHYLLGNTEEVAQVAQEAPAVPDSRPQTAPEAAVTPVVRKVAAQSPERAVNRPKLPAVAAPPPAPAAARGPTARMAVQVGAFAESRAAEKLAASLRAKGYTVYLSPGADSGDARWRVRVGPFGSREEAGRTATRLKTAEKLPTWVLSEDS